MTSKLLDQLAGTFREEARERLAELESTLLALESNPDDPELVARAFRAMHTLKGNGRMFGFEEVSSFAHEIETTFDLVRKGRLAVDHKLIGLALNSLDLIGAMVEGTTVDPTLRDHLVDAFRQMQPSDAPLSMTPSPPPARPEPAPAPSPKPPAAPAAVGRTYRIQFEPDKDLFRDGTNPLGIFDELGGLGSCRITAQIDRVPALEDLDPEACHLAWDIMLTTAHDESAIRDAFIFVEGRGKLRIAIQDAGAQVAVTPEVPKPAQAKKIVTADLRVTRESLAQTSSLPAIDNTSSVRVAASKLDQLVDLVGELVVSQSRLAQVAHDRNDEELRSLAENLERLSNGLRDNTLDMRMVPIGTTFSRFMRLVRDLSTELGKDIQLTTDGAETELDKTVIERIGDPLVHLIRNSCDHGVESPSERIAKGKPGRGTVRLSAYHSGDSVTIEVADDGAGLNVETLRARGVEQGLISPDAQLTEREIFNLIFLPGFSTAKTVSNVSGRGVGMDVVKRSIEALRGSVDIDGRLGQGTTIRLKLPLTLAIIDGLLVTVGDAFYVLPMSALETCVELTNEDLARANGNHLTNVRGELVPTISLRQWFGVKGERPSIEQIAIANTNGQRMGFVVDQVIGQHQTVLKSLGKVFKTVRELSGATILGDGNVALVIDVNMLSQNVATSTDARSTVC
jgi:two-component system chemotaxis sensor kinase CheA